MLTSKYPRNFLKYMYLSILSSCATSLKSCSSAVFQSTNRNSYYNFLTSSNRCINQIAVSAVSEINIIRLTFLHLCNQVLLNRKNIVAFVECKAFYSIFKLIRFLFHVRNEFNRKKHILIMFICFYLLFYLLRTPFKRHVFYYTSQIWARRKDNTFPPENSFR